MQLFSLFIEYGAWSWLVIGLVLLALELVLPGGVFLWLGISAVITSLVRFLVVTDWPVQVSIFGVLSVVSIALWLRLVKSGSGKSDRPLLNRRAERHVGEEIVLNEPISGGVGRVPIGDTIWRVAGPDLPAGRKVKVVGHDGPVLRVEAA